MKNVYYIGRDDSCDIILQDDSNIISRTHAILRVGKGCKYTISDQSMNGTYVNGIRISSGVEVPVSRTDIISFAHLVDFDWSLIPNQAKKTRIIVLSVIGGLIIIGALCWGAVKLFGEKQPVFTETSTSIDNTSDNSEVAADSVKTVTPPASEKTTAKKAVSEKPVAKATKEKEPTKETSAEPVETENQLTATDTAKTKKNINAIF